MKIYVSGDLCPKCKYPMILGKTSVKRCRCISDYKFTASPIFVSNSKVMKKPRNINNRHTAARITKNYGKNTIELDVFTSDIKMLERVSKWLNKSIEWMKKCEKK